MDKNLFKRVLKRRINFVKQPITNFLFQDHHRRVNQYAKFYEGLKVRDKTIFYESRDGESMTDSPYAMFLYMLKNKDFNDYIHIWSVQDDNMLLNLREKYRKFPNVKFVKRNSVQYLKYLATCKYLINNSTFQSFFIAKPDQVYINTWHGTPLKYMGFDIPGNPSQSQNVLRNFLSTDYLISPNSHTTKIFTDSYKLNGLYEGTIIEEGYPRIDLTLNIAPDSVLEDLINQGVKIDKSKQTLLYAPTWKGSHISDVQNDLPQIIADMKELQKEIGDQYNILTKVHPFLYKEAIHQPEIQNQLVPDSMDPNELLAAVDLLVTDYSSIFFDFLVTDKPILFYTWDLDVYSEERGQYLDRDDLPGPILFNCKELIDAVKNIETVKETFREKYRRLQRNFTKYENGKVTERIVHNIMNHTSENLNTISCFPSEKKKILIYSGGMRDNGITSSFINLLNNLDYDQFDVSCFTATPHHPEVLKNLDKINKNVRFLFKPGLPVYKMGEVYKDQFIQNRGERGVLGKSLFPEQAYERENMRLFGKTRFDYAIDFSGYSLFYAKYLVVSNAKRKICFMHNDLLSDSERTINGKRPHRVNLRGLFSIYHRFDKLVSVSEGTMEVNRKKLSQYADAKKFDYVMNSISPDKILHSSEEKDESNGMSEKSKVTTQVLKARAIITDGANVFVRINLTDDSTDFRFFTDPSLEQTEIYISRQATYQNQTYYRFHHKDRVVGWIPAEACTLLPDSIIEKQNVNKIAKVIRPKGNHIFSAPYNVEESEKVSSSWDYRNVILRIDQEAKTQHSQYSRISINETVIGWIDNRALQVFKSCTIDDRANNIDRLKINIKRKILLLRSQQKNRSFLNNLENRTLREFNIEEPLFARITNPSDKVIWTKAYSNYGIQKVAEATEYAGQIVQLKTMQKTRKGTYFLFYHDDQKIGWLKDEAFKIIKEQAVSQAKEISGVAEIQSREGDQILDQPDGLGAVATVKNVKFLDGSIVIIDKEYEKREGKSYHILKNGIPLGWLDAGALAIKEVLGIEVEGQFIPEPSRENFNFVNVGRLSPEKAQDNLIHAFAQFHRKHQNSKLYILGKGPLKDELNSLIRELDLSDAAYLMGQLEDPFSFMKKCDAFVLSSHYEGQPMVLLEAMTLGMKVVATDIVANRTVLENGKYGLLVEDSIRGIEKGMNAVHDARETPVKEKFDYHQYNTEAMETFYKSLN